MLRVFRVWNMGCIWVNNKEIHFSKPTIKTEERTVDIPYGKRMKENTLYVGTRQCETEYYYFHNEPGKSSNIS